MMRFLDQEEEIEEFQGCEGGKILTFVAEEGMVPETFGFELEENYAVPRPKPEVFDELVVL